MGATKRKFAVFEEVLRPVDELEDGFLICEIAEGVLELLVSVGFHIMSKEPNAIVRLDLGNKLVEVLAGGKLLCEAFNIADILELAGVGLRELDEILAKDSLLKGRLSTIIDPQLLVKLSMLVGFLDSRRKF